MKRGVYFAFLTAFFAVRAAVCHAQDAPGLEVYYPPGNTFECATKEIPVVGQATCSGCSLLIDNKIVPLDQDGSFQANVALKPGINILNVRLKDTAGGVVEKTIQVRVKTGGSELTPAPGALPELPDLIPPVEFPRSGYGEAAPMVESAIAEPGVTTYIPSPQEPVAKHSSQSGKKQHGKYHIRSFSISLYHHGKLIGRFNSDEVIIRNNRLFVPLNLNVWKELNASVDTKKEAIIFKIGNNQEDISFSIDELRALSPRSFKINNRIYIPFRSITETAHFQVDYKPGRIDLDDIGLRVPAKALIEDNVGKAEINGYLNSDVLFVKLQNFSSIKGIKLEKSNQKDTYKVANAKGDQITLIIYKNSRIIVKINKKQIYAFVLNKGPGRDLCARGYTIPLRQIMQTLGYQVHWNHDELLASVTLKNALASRK